MDNKTKNLNKILKTTQSEINNQAGDNEKYLTDNFTDRLLNRASFSLNKRANKSEIFNKGKVLQKLSEDKKIKQQNLRLVSRIFQIKRQKSKFEQSSSGFMRKNRENPQRSRLITLQNKRLGNSIMMIRTGKSAERVKTEIKQKVQKILRQKLAKNQMITIYFTRRGKLLFTPNFYKAALRLMIDTAFETSISNNYFIFKIMETYIDTRIMTKDRNIAFFEIIEKQNLKRIDNDIDLTLLNKRIKIVKRNFGELSRDEVLEWTQIHRKKIQQLHSLYKLNKLNKKGNAQSSLKLREQLRMLISCSDVGIDYQAKEIQQIIREVYFDVYQQHVLPTFVKVGFPITQFETLQFQEQQQARTSWFSFLCCCSKKQKR